MNILGLFLTLKSDYQVCHEQGIPPDVKWDMLDTQISLK